jgi:elongation factor G
MPGFATADIHNILLVGQGGSGKTTLADAMLFEAKAVGQKGSVPDGSSVSDFEKEEKEHQHSIFASVLHMDFQGRRINVIDAPGSTDLIAQAITCLPAVETVVIVLSPQTGVDSMARRIFEMAKELGLPRAFVINKIDLPDANLVPLLKQIRDTFGPQCFPINLPTNGGKAVLDCLLSNAGASDLGPVAQHHGALLDQIVELDDALMEKYLGGEEPNYDALHAPFERAMDEGHVLPICFTDAKSGAGVRELLDIIVRHFPNPLEGNPRPFFTGEGASEKPFIYANDSDKPLIAHVFKVMTDPFVGKLAYFRVYQGRATGASQVFIGASRKAVRLAHVFHLQGKEHPEADAIIAGDIGAVAKIEEIKVGDVLHDDHALDQVHHKSMRFPTPLYGLAVAPKSRGDEQKISGILQRFMEEDPTFKIAADTETHELVMYGLGELQLRIVLERLKNRSIEVTTRPPKIAYREAITAKGEGHYRHKKQTGGAGQFAEVFLRVEPLARGAGFEFVNDIFGGSIPAQFLVAVEKGVRDMMDTGVIAGYPIQDVRVSVFDGKTHPVDSKEIAFRTAGKFAFKEAILKARPVILEPMVNIEVTTPADKVGTITGDLSGKRGRIQGTETLSSGIASIRATAPLSEVLHYPAQLKGLTGGQGTFAMEYSHYDPVPPQIQQQIVLAYKPKAEES